MDLRLTEARGILLRVVVAGLALAAARVAVGMDVHVTQNTAKLMPYQVFEITFQHEGKFRDPTWDVTIEVSFRSPGGRNITVGGFFYGSSKEQKPVLHESKGAGGQTVVTAAWPCDPADLWKARLAPDELGEWKFEYVLRTGGGETAKGSGKFVVVRGRVHPRGFVRIHPENPFRFVFDDGSPFWPVGYQDGVGDWNHNGSVMDVRGVEGPFRTEAHGVGIEGLPKLPAGPLFARGPSMGSTNGDVDFRRHAQAGFNLWRFSPNNNTMKVFYKSGGTRSPGLDEVDWMEARQVDEMLQMTRKYKFVNFYGIFGYTGVSNDKPGDESAMAKVKRIVKYSVDRWGAYVDFWEFLNEQKADTKWYEIMIPYLKSVDPYHHPVTTSWERADVDGIEIDAPHWYVTEDELSSDAMIQNNARQSKNFKKPVICGEQGNSRRKDQRIEDGWGGVWDPGSARRMRVRLWSAFQNEVALIFWETSYARDGHHMNIWIGPEERQYVKALRDFSEKVDRGVTMTKVTLGGAQAHEARACGLGSEETVAVYLHHWQCAECGRRALHLPKHTWDHDRGEVKDLKVTVDVPKAMKGYWYSPADAEILARFDAPAGTQTFTAPAFRIDLALLITDAPPIDSDGDGIPNDLDDDDDNDGVPDAKDAWPLERDEWADVDHDRIGDNMDADIDGDGKPDDLNHNGIPDCEEKDWDGDGVANAGAIPWDAFPRDPREWRDTDGDGIGDNADDDKDGDGYSDAEEKAARTDPLNPLSFP